VGKHCRLTTKHEEAELAHKIDEDDSGMAMSVTAPIHFTPLHPVPLGKSPLQVKRGSGTR
jgi:hypothetical protein